MKRTKDSELTEDHLKLFHQILRMIENDEDGFDAGLNWTKVKKWAAAHGVTVENATKKKVVIVPEEIDCNTIIFNVSSSIGKSFIKSLRNAFAHNRITYNDDSKYFTIHDTVYRNPSRLKLNCKVTFEQLQAIKSLITNTKKQKEEI